ncbi:hypothetical protein [Pradoshia eiseniae]|uniref:hypothetical protein n=1 Tax=Pradoshia eiseniae TaxID=2064768 RepID=UPI00191BD1C0|nr:hypothetical protein [Pradoshia eiseniae]
MKRKAQFDAAEKASKTPKRNLRETNEQETEFSAEFSGGESEMKGFNRNSNRGRKGK